MNRRGFLQALFAMPVIAAPLLVPAAIVPAHVDEPAPHISYLPRTYAGRLDYIASLVDAGVITRPMAVQMLRASVQLY